MPNASPVNQLTTYPARFEVGRHDNISFGPELRIPEGQVPSSVETFVYNVLTGADVSVTIKNSVPVLSNIVDNVCVATQLLHAWTLGVLYLHEFVITATSGQKFTYSTYFDCVA